MEEGLADTVVEEGLADTAVEEGLADTAVEEGLADTVVARNVVPIFVDGHRWLLRQSSQPADSWGTCHVVPLN